MEAAQETIASEAVNVETVEPASVEIPPQEQPSSPPSQQQQQQIPRQEEHEHVIQQPPPPPPPNEDEDEDEDDDDYDDDDDEEKDNSQKKLVIDINEDEKDDEDDDDDDDVVEVQVLEKVTVEPGAPSVDPPEQKAAEEQKEETSTIVPAVDVKPAEPAPAENIEAIITLSDAEEETAAMEATTKPGKVQKRKSMGASAGGNNEEERYRLKRRKINAEGAPKMPLTGYVRFMNDRRESVRKDHPNKNSIEVTKLIAEEWQSLPSDVKGEYLKAAEADKQRYLKELHTFLKSRPDILASELAKNKSRKTDNNNSNNATNSKSLPKEKAQNSENATKTSKDAAKEKTTPKETQPIPSTSTQNCEKQQPMDKNRRKRTPTPPFSNASTSTVGPSTSAAASTSASSIVTPTPGEIPIFTNEFLEHNKTYDMELRSLRKSKTDLEQQNFVLEKHVENMKSGVEKMISENNELQEKNRLLEIYLDKLKCKLAQALGTLPLPSAPNGATVENIDKYMQDLYKMSTSNSHGPATLNKAKDIIRKLDLQIQL